MREKSVLLRLIEAVNFVDENDGSRAVLAGPLRVGHDLLDLFDSGQHSGKFQEVGFGHARNDLGQRSLPRPRRSPEDERAGIIAIDLRPQRLAWTDQVLLADEFVERPRAHAVRQWPCTVRGGMRVRNGWKQAHGGNSSWFLALSLWRRASESTYGCLSRVLDTDAHSMRSRMALPS